MYKNGVISSWIAQYGCKNPQNTVKVYNLMFIVSFLVQCAGTQSHKNRNTYGLHCIVQLATKVYCCALMKVQNDW